MNLLNFKDIYVAIVGGFLVTSIKSIYIINFIFSYQFYILVLLLKPLSLNSSILLCFIYWPRLNIQIMNFILWTLLMILHMLMPTSFILMMKKHVCLIILATSLNSSIEKHIAWIILNILLASYIFSLINRLLKIELENTWQINYNGSSIINHYQPMLYRWLKP